VKNCTNIIGKAGTVLF